MLDAARTVAVGIGWAEWCGPCRIVGPTIERLAKDYTGRLLTVKVNVDHRPQVAERYEIESIPTIMLFWQGESLPIGRQQAVVPVAHVGGGEHRIQHAFPFRGAGILRR